MAFSSSLDRNDDNDDGEWQGAIAQLSVRRKTVLCAKVRCSATSRREMWTETRSRGWEWSNSTCFSIHSPSSTTHWWMCVMHAFCPGGATGNALPKGKSSHSNLWMNGRHLFLSWLTIAPRAAEQHRNDKKKRGEMTARGFCFMHLWLPSLAPTTKLNRTGTLTSIWHGVFGRDRRTDGRWH